MNLRPYQKDAVNDTVAGLSDATSALGVAATGLGKTVILSHVAAHYARDARVMLIAHREELVYQGAAKMEQSAGIKAGIEMNVHSVHETMWGKPKAVVATVQSLTEDRIKKFDPAEFGLLIIDEAHHATGASYRRVIDHFARNPNARVFGVTATPDRMDEQALGQVFDRSTFDYDIDFGVDQSWLVPINATAVRVTGLDFSAVRSMAGDLNEGDLAELMEQEEIMHEIVDPTIQIIGGRRAIVFCASVLHAEKTAEIFNRHRNGMAAWICGKTPKDVRRQLLQDFAQGRIQVMCNVGVLTEGFDDPGVEVVVMARPTESRALYAQMAGRGTRPLPAANIDAYPNHAQARRDAIAASRKPSLSIIDFVGNAGKHELISAADILGGNFDPKVVAAVKKMAESGDVNVRKAMNEEAARAQQARMEEARRRRKDIIAKADYQVFELDPFSVLGVAPIQSRRYARKSELSEGMRRQLIQAGIKPDGLCYAAARRLLHADLSRGFAQQTRFREAAILTSLGESVPQRAADAHRRIQELRKEALA